ncbi:MAG: PrsW family intramembrane metalloprotease [Bacteroidetes bacterium]|mgnify:FL=1|jgi:protease PrsW|nr:PrsW family intramembrane metalloprotease [Bacteroidota bacterium]MBT4401480.1 PrsW family intramembrane metalloprotease [Bacteroidota bacterium]MBT4411180.1 PrsW family intramembrane metalloprotease [Bacteroidota bacterium]MBT5425519.1 PrsW family intramembrane metalloprotease [Bacteroidota bacterium]MBT7095202.1 PrsW family intramembrane metalloprotease [Bacteroidota bacterium]
MTTIFIALAPVLIILFYVYFRDKYEKEPIGLLLKALLAGAIITIPIYFIEVGLSSFGASVMDGSSQIIWSAFVVAAGTEEVFKFIALFILIWANRNFNERFDGIVYAVFVSLGFALVENLLYVIQGGIEVGWLRAITAVPGHALFGVTMGYYLGLARFCSGGERTGFIVRALFWPIILHGFYDYCLMSGIPLLMLAFIPFIIYLWIQGFKKMKQLSDQSRFRY